MRRIILLACTTVVVSAFTSGSSRTGDSRANRATVSILDDAAVTELNGVTKYEGKPFTGMLRSHYKNGATKRLASYRGGRLDGLARGWYANGSPWYVRTYRLGREEGVHLGWWENGAAKFIFNYHDGKAEGLSREWFEDGGAFTEFYFVAGHESGRQRMWTRYGTLRANYVIKNGRRFGLMGSMGCEARQEKTERS